MKQNFECEIAQTEGSLIRVLGVIERRGHRLQELAVQPAGPDGFRLSFSIESTRDVSILVKQLERLFDVRDVFLLPGEPELASRAKRAATFPVDDGTWKLLADIARDYGIDAKTYLA